MQAKLCVLMLLSRLQDIDNEPIEQALLRQLDESIISMIAEFFTGEHRFSHGWSICTVRPAPPAH